MSATTTPPCTNSQLEHSYVFRSRSPVTPPGNDGEPTPADASTGDARRSASEAQDELKFNWKEKLLEILHEEGLSETHLMAETWTQLEGVKEDVACNVVKRISESNIRNVRNFDGFARSILRRIVEQGIDVGSAELSDLPSSVRDAVNRHLDDRVVTETDFCSVQVVKALKDLPVESAVEAVDQFAKSNLDTVRNRTGFFMSIIRRVREETQYGGRGGGGYGGRERGGGYGGRDRGGHGGRERYGDRSYGHADLRGGGYSADRYGGDRYGGDRYGGERYGGDRHGRDRYERPRY